MNKGKIIDIMRKDIRLHKSNSFYLDVMNTTNQMARDGQPLYKIILRINRMLCEE